MSAQLRDGLRMAASAAGCSLNAYAVQVLAAAAGHHARFRGTAETGPTDCERAQELRAIPRDSAGFPFDMKTRRLHREARAAFHAAAREGSSFLEVERLVKKLDKEDPAHFVEWLEAREPEGRQ
jgi:hypothetical protein